MGLSHYGSGYYGANHYTSGFYRPEDVDSGRTRGYRGEPAWKKRRAQILREDEELLLFIKLFMEADK